MSSNKSVNADLCRWRFALPHRPVTSNVELSFIVGLGAWLEVSE